MELLNFVKNYSKYVFDKNKLNIISNPEIRKETEKSIVKYEEKCFKETKKSIASNFSVLSDIFLHLIKMIIAPLVLAVLVIGVAKVGDFKSVGRIGLKTLIYFNLVNHRHSRKSGLPIGVATVNVGTLCRAKNSNWLRSVEFCSGGANDSEQSNQYNLQIL